MITVYRVHHSLNIGRHHALGYRCAAMNNVQ